MFIELILRGLKFPEQSDNGRPNSYSEKGVSAGYLICLLSNLPWLKLPRKYTPLLSTISWWQIHQPLLAISQQEITNRWAGPWNQWHPQSDWWQRDGRRLEWDTLWNLVASRKWQLWKGWILNEAHEIVPCFLESLWSRVLEVFSSSSEPFEVRAFSALTKQQFFCCFHFSHALPLDPYRWNG